jgi:hypothetical protein
VPHYADRRGDLLVAAPTSQSRHHEGASPGIWMRPAGICVRPTRRHILPGTGSRIRSRGDIRRSRKFASGRGGDVANNARSSRLISNRTPSGICPWTATALSVSVAPSGRSSTPPTHPVHRCTARQ